MREYLNENTLFSTLMLAVSDARSLYLVVEGPDDQMLIKDHCSEDLVVMSGCGGREQVLRTAELATKRKLGRVRFLVDRDFDDFLGSSRASIENVVSSDTHDCFMDIVYHDPRILSRVVEVESATVSRRSGSFSALVVPHPSQVLKEASRLSLMLSSLRIVSGRRNLGLDFKKFPFGLISPLRPSVEQMADILFKRVSLADEVQISVVEDARDLFAELEHDSSGSIGDHDYFSALASVMKMYGTSIRDSQLQRSFLAAAAFSCSGLYRTSWFREVQDWAEEHGRQGFSCNQ